MKYHRLAIQSRKSPDHTMRGRCGLETHGIRLAGTCELAADTAGALSAGAGLDCSVADQILLSLPQVLDLQPP